MAGWFLGHRKNFSMQGPQFELDAQQPQSLINGPCLSINMPHRTLVWDVPLITALAVGTRQKATSLKGWRRILSGSEP
jgi:hypothetical protein